MSRPRSLIGLLAPGLAAAVLAGCGSSGPNLDSIASCLKGKGFTVERSAGTPKIKEKGYLTVTSPANEVIQTVALFQDANAAKYYYGATKSSSGASSTLKGKLDITGTSKEGKWGQKFDSCVH
jgi:hypothetical protein